MSVSEKLRQKSFAETIPLAVMFELTRRCNLNCDHCYVDHHIKEQLTVTQLDKIFADIAKAGGLMLAFTGGEVALRKDLPEIVEAARAYKFNIKMNSSASLWSDDDIAVLAKLQLRQVNVSVYSNTAAVHDQVVRHKGAFGKTIHAVRRLRAHGIKVVLQCPLLQSNVDEIPGIIALALELGCTSSFDPVVSPMEDGRTDPCVLRLSAGQIAHIYAAGGVIEYMGDEGGSDGALLPEWQEGAAICSAGRALAFIDSRGDVFPCVAWREKVGNAVATPFDQLWRSAPEFLRMRQLTTSSLSECHDCTSKGYCNYCPGLSHAERQDAALAAPSACNAAEGKRLFYEHQRTGEPIVDPGFFGQGRYPEGKMPRGRRQSLRII